MTLSLDKPKLDNLANEIWKSAERLRGKFKAYEYQNVILPIIVIRRLECVLLKWREEKKKEILVKQPKRTEKELEQLVKRLEQNLQQSPFSNKTDWTLRRVYEEDHTLLEENFRAYINGFSQNVDDIIEHFNYRAGMPRTNDGALLFLQTMLAKMQPPEKEGSRIAIIFNGSPLSNGDCGSGESEIRRWILENDWLDAIVMLPDQLFYNTGIFTYIWLLRNEKPESHRGLVMLIDARKQFEKEPKSFGNKRNRITDAHRGWIEKHYRKGWKAGYQNEDVKLFKTTDFSYHKVNVVFWQTDEHDQPAMITEPYEKTFTPPNIKKEQEFYAGDLHFNVHMSFSPRPLAEGSDVKEQPDLLFEVTFTLKPKDNFQTVFESAIKKALSLSSGKTLPPSIPPDGGTGSGGRGVGEPFFHTDPKSFKEFLKALNVEEVTWTHRHYLKDDEYIPYGEDIEDFLKREIAKPIIHWQDSPQLGYEILPNKYFYRYQPPPPAKELLEEFWRLEKKAEKTLTRLSI